MSTTDQCRRGHDRVYSGTVLAAFPPIHPWICRRCMAEGRETTPLPPLNEYEELKRLKRAQEGER
jgi:hypothetical protein